MPMNISALRPPTDLTPPRQELWDTCQQLEEVFWKLLLKEMRVSVPSDLFSGGIEDSIYEDIRNDALAEQIVKSGQLGLAAQLYRQLSAQLPPEGSP